MPRALIRDHEEREREREREKTDGRLALALAVSTKTIVCMCHRTHLIEKNQKTHRKHAQRLLVHVTAT